MRGFTIGSLRFATLAALALTVGSLSSPLEARPGDRSGARALGLASHAAEAAPLPGSVSVQELTPDQMDAMATPPACGWPAAVGPVAGILALDEGQVGALVHLLEARHTAVATILPEILGRRAVLEQLLGAPEPDPTAIGHVLLEIRTLEAGVVATQIDFLTAFDGLLLPAQRDQLHGLRVAANLVPVLPAFAVLGLI